MNKTTHSARIRCGAIFLAAVIAGAPLARTQPSVQTFLEIGSIQGEAELEKHKKKIEVVGFTSGVQMPLSDNPGSGVGKPQFFEIQVSKKVDRASPLLFVHCATGTRFPTAVLTVSSVTEKRTFDFFKIVLNDVAITRVESTGSAGKAGGIAEAIALSFSRIRWTYSFLNVNGKLVTITGGYDLQQGVPL